MAEEKTILLTQEAYDKMKEELAWREGEYRDEILSKVSAARAEGDLSENGGYQAAREAQRVNQGRIDELTVKLRNAKILTAPKAGEVGDGSLVTLEVNGREWCTCLARETCPSPRITASSVLNRRLAPPSMALMPEIR